MKRIAIVIFFLIVCISIFQVIKNLWQGTFPTQPLKINEPVTWTIFESELRPISIKYPQDWTAWNLPQGYGGDKDIIGSISPLHPDYPWVYIASHKLGVNTLEAMAKWGENRLWIREADHKTISQEKVMINGEEVLLRKYYYLDYRPQRVDCSQVYLSNDSDAYTVVMCVDEKNDSPELQTVFEEMINSISFQ